MELINATEMPAAYTMGMKPDGRELLVVVVKGTFMIPQSGEESSLAGEQAPLVMADEFTGEPGFSAPKYESDFAPVKPRCDVLLLGSAYAPGGNPAEKITVSLRVGSISKSFDLVGDRVWKTGLTGLEASRPKPVTVVPISYDNAFGGVDNLQPDPARHRTYLSNHVGKGFYEQADPQLIDGKPLPNTQESKQPITSPRGSYRPMAFGPVGRAWQPRPQFAGAYDQNWIDNVFPFLPADFDERYYQSAPADQQTDYLKGGEEVVLLNLTPQGQTTFNLPTISMPITFYFKNYEEKETAAVCDTLILEPDLGRFMMAWRASIPLKKNIFEVAQAVAGRMPRGWYRARELGKTWYPSLKELVDEKKAEREETGEEAEETADEVEP